MRAIRSRRGAALIDALLAMFLLAITGLVFSASMPVGTSCARQAQEYKTATAIASQKMEEIRSLPFQDLTPSMLLTYQKIDSITGGTSRLYFTATNQVATKLAQGYGYIYLTSISSDTKRVSVSVRWRASRGNVYRSIRLTSYVVDKRTRKAN